MRKYFVLLFISISASFLFAQNDFQVIAEVNLTKREPITVGELKVAVKNFEATTHQKTTAEQRRQVLDSLIDSKLVLQLAKKQGIKIPDSRVNEYFQGMLSNMVGQAITESQFEQLIKGQGYASFDAFMNEQTGMTVARYKEFIRDQLIGQAYILNSYGEKIEKIDATDEEIKQAYESNKQSFVRPDMLTTFMVVVEKKGQTADEKAKADALRARLVANPKLTEQIAQESRKENSGFFATNLYVYKTEQSAQTFGISMAQLMELFNLKINTVTDVKEMPGNFQFFLIMKKDNMKFLGLDDKMDPSQDVTVRQIIQSNIRGQKQNIAFANFIQEVVATVKNEKSCKISKSDEELLKLLAW